MCGIAGVIAWDDRYRVDRQTLARMSARIAHRGPDGEGFYLNHEQEVTPDRPQCGLAFRRLAILDPDPRAMQPFTIGERTIVFNGEIYNFRELRAELTKLRPEYAWRTTGDTEVLLLAYNAWGDECLERLNGMFAFAVWDERDKSLFLARDRMGQKPLYCCALGGGQRKVLAFASELSAFDPLPWADRTISHARLIQYLRFGYTGQSIYQSVWQIGPGEMWRTDWDDDNVEYFDCNEPGEAHQPHQPHDLGDASRARELVRRAVARQLVSDVPLGCLLSGGIDSSVVAASMVAATGSAAQVQTFSIGFDDPRYDESRYAEDVAAHLGVRHHRFTVRADAAEDLPRLAAVFGAPFADSSALPTHYLAREVRRHVKVALSGDGGDELFGGYDRYRAMRLEPLIRRVPSPVRGALAGAVQRRMPGGNPKSGLSRVTRLLGSIDLSPAARYESYVRLFDEATLDELLGPPPRRPPKPLSRFADVFERLAAGRDAVRAALAADRITYLPGDLLTKVDRASMLHGLEVRSPFMDHELVQFAAGLTTDQLLRGGPKRMLREAFADDLPAWVFKRKKMGFAVPIGEWFRGELRPMLRDHLFAAGSFARQHFDMKVVERLVDEHETQRVDHSQRLYALLMLELWWRGAR